jgi:hypothetical protein
VVYVWRGCFGETQMRIRPKREGKEVPRGQGIKDNILPTQYSPRSTALRGSILRSTVAPPTVRR